jgi:hypothetical protein
MEKNYVETILDKDGYNNCNEYEVKDAGSKPVKMDFTPQGVQGNSPQSDSFAY